MKTKEKELKFLFRGNFYSQEKLKSLTEFAELEAPALVYGEELPFSSFVYVFSNVYEMNEWAQKTKIGSEVSSCLKLLPNAQAQEANDHKRAKKKLKQKANRIVKDLKELSEITGLSTGSMELLKRATVEAPLIEGSIFDPALLYTDIGFEGTVTPLWSGLWLPDFRWFDMNDRVSSVHALGFIALFEHIWWQGASVWLFSHSVADLRLAFNFNDEVSSAIHF